MSEKQQRPSQSVEPTSCETSPPALSSEGPLVDEGLGDGPWSLELEAYDASVRAGRAVIDGASTYLDLIDPASSAARTAYKAWDAEGVQEQGAAAADAAQEVNDAVSVTWKHADAAFEADGGSGFDGRLGDLELEALDAGSDVDTAMERAVERLSLTGSTAAATPGGIRSATKQAAATAERVAGTLATLDADVEGGLEAAAGASSEEVALLKLAVATTQPELLPAMKDFTGVNVDLDAGSEHFESSANGSTSVSTGESGGTLGFDAVNGKVSVGVKGEKTAAGQLSASYDGDALSVGREVEGKNGRKTSANMEFDGLELAKVSLGAGKSWDAGGAKISAGIGVDVHTKDTLDGLEENGTGEAVDGYGVNGNLGVGGKVFGVSGSAGYSDVTTTKARNLRGGGSEYDVMRESGGNWGFGASSAAGGLYFTGSDVDIDGRTIRFDATEQGDAARRHYNRTRELPPGGGYQIVSTEKGQAKRDGYAFSMFGLGVGNQDELRTTTTTDENGTETERTRSTDQTSARLPFVGSVVNHTNALEEMRVVGADTSMWMATTHIQDASADDAHAGLAASTQGNPMRDIEGDASGSWAVQSVLDEGSMDAFLDRAENGKDYKTYGLRQALAGASSEAERKAALHAWVQAEGDDAIQAIRAHAPTLDYVALEGDRYLTGLQGQMEYEDQLLAFRAKLKDPAADKKGVVEDVRSQLAYHQARRSHLEDRSNYPDLPGPLRKKELDRSKRAIKALEGVRTQALSIMEHDPDYAEGRNLVLQNAADERFVAREKDAAYEARDDARATLWRHQMRGVPTLDSVRAQNVESLREKHAATYEKAEAEYERGEGFLKTGVKAEADLVGELAKDEETAAASMEASTTAGNWFHRSKRAYRNYLDQMDAIDGSYDDRAPLNLQGGLPDFYAPSSVDEA